MSTSKTKGSKNTIFINTTSSTEEVKMELYAKLAELLYESVDSVIKGFSRNKLDISKKEDRIKYVLKTNNILINASGFSEEEKPSKMSFFDIKEIVNGILNETGKIGIDTVKSHFVKLGLSAVKHDDVSFYLQLCVEAERKNLLKKEKSSEVARIYRTTKNMVCPNCGHTHFYSMGSVSRDGKTFKKYQCKKCSKTIVPDLWAEDNIIGKKETALSVFGEYYGSSNPKEVDRGIFLSSVKS